MSEHNRTPWECKFNNLEDCITAYFHLGCQYKKILAFLSVYHGIQLTLRQLRYFINKKLHLKRKGNMASDEDVLHAISLELNSPSKLVGYRAMTDILQKKYALTISRHRVMEVMRMVSPVDTLLRRQHRLRRRKYKSYGPNWAWHIDGYDKLSPWGFCISGAIDGFSRKMVYLKVGPTNHDPRIVGYYYMDAVKMVGGCPQIVQTDCGSENGIVATLQTLFCSQSPDNVCVNRNHIYSTSPSNQRIECWWSQLRKSTTDFWIKEFKQLTEEGKFCIGNYLHKWCLQFCFMDIIQQDLDFFAYLWNSHRIRSSRMSECLSGIPNKLYHLPDSFNVDDYKVEVSSETLEYGYGKCSKTSVTGNVDFEEYMEYLMEFFHLEKPRDYQSAIRLYLKVLPLVEGE